MMRLLLPIIFTAAGIALFVTYTNPTYQHIKDLQVQNNSFDEALTKAQELRQVRDNLLQKRNSFAQADVDKLQNILPDNVDTIRLIIDINNIAAKHSMVLSDVNLGNAPRPNSTDPAAAAADASASPVGSTSLTFSVTSSYSNFLAFLQDLEHSLRLVDVQKIAFTAGANDSNAYALTLNTYWLK